MKRWFGLALLLPVAACDQHFHKDLVYVGQTDRPIRSAAFRTCGRDFTLREVDGLFQAWVPIPGGCEGTLDIVMAEGDELSCHVDGIQERGWRRHFVVRNDRCVGLIEIPMDVAPEPGRHH